MPTCGDCKFYKPVDGAKGVCTTLGNEIQANREAERCPMRMFQPKG
jgi:hypothetical protein